MKRDLIKSLCLGAVLILCTGLGIFFAWEHSLPPIGETITVVGMKEGVTVKDDTAFPTGETVSRTISSTDGEFSALQEGLEALRYSHILQPQTMPDTEDLCRLCRQLTR